MERKCERREAMTTLINIKRQQRDQKHLWVWGSRMALGRGVSGPGLCSEVSAMGGTRGNMHKPGQGICAVPSRHDGDAQHTSLAPLDGSPGIAQCLAMGYVWWDEAFISPSTLFHSARSSEDRFMSLGLL